MKMKEDLAFTKMQDRYAYGSRSEKDAQEVVNTYSYEQLVHIMKTYGEESSHLVLPKILLSIEKKKRLKQH